MPAGPQICRQRASARRTSVHTTFLGGWTGGGRRLREAREADGRHNPETTFKKMERGQTIDLSDQACLAGWPSPLANKQSPQQRKDFTPNLANVAQLTIPLEASDTNANTLPDVTTSADSPQDVAAECAVNSPTNAQDSPEQCADSRVGHTPTARDHKDYGGELGQCASQQTTGTGGAAGGLVHSNGAHAKQERQRQGFEQEYIGPSSYPNWRNVEWLPCADGNSAANSTRNSPAG